MLSIIVPWCNRNELGKAVPSLVREAATVDASLLIVNYGGDDARLAPQLAGSTDRLSVVSVPRVGHFNKCAAHNLGAAHANSEFFFFCDCDIILDEGTLSNLLRVVSRCEGTFATLKGVRESEKNARKAGFVTCFGYTLRLRTADGRALEIVDSEEDAETGLRNAPGLLLVRRSDFHRIDGYNGDLIGWGWEDQDMISRLTLGAGLARELVGTATHVSHDDHARVSQYPVINRWESRDRMFREALERYDAGNFMGTYTRDVARHDTQELESSLDMGVRA